jgi:hypothetical protein
LKDRQCQRILQKNGFANKPGRPPSGTWVVTKYLKSASKKSVQKNTLAFGYRLPKSVWKVQFHPTTIYM